MAAERSREVRFGLVMYGGVSLAIYINGVTHEFWRAVRGDGVYRLLKILTDSDVSVDVVSGSSAGGINGIFLCYALANGKDFGDMAHLWRKQGDIELLMRKIDTPIDECRSLLDSEKYYEGELLSALRNMKAAASSVDAYEGEMDLFVTGTHVDGKVYTVLDDDGHPIDVKDHRTVFWIKHRPERKLPFDSEKNVHVDEALARLARLTSCFPAAFEPVHVSAGELGTAEPDDDRHAWLRRWGVFRDERYFLDGGVLNNKPFTPTIKAIFQRRQDRPVQRYLAYVEPDPDFFPNRSVEAPNFLQATIDGAFQIKGYESIADDLTLINEHNTAVDKYWHLCRRLRENLNSKLLDELTRSGPLGVVLPAAYVDASSASKAMYERARFSQMAMRALRGAITTDGERNPIEPGQHERVSRLVSGLYEMEASAEGRILTSEESFARFDVYFRSRRLYHVAYRIGEAMHDDPGNPGRSAWVLLWRRVNLQLEIVEIVESAMHHVMDYAQINWVDEATDVWGEIRRVLERLLALDGDPKTAVPNCDGDDVFERAPALLRSFYSALMARARAVVDCSKTAPPLERTKLAPPSFDGLLAHLDALAWKQFHAAPPAEPGAPPWADSIKTFRDEFAQYVALDSLVFPLEFTSGLESKDRIHLLRVSPRDAQLGFSRRPSGDKLAGDALAHFGGFFKRSWRSNDLLWGRLDAVCELVKTLMSAERLASLGAVESLRRAVLDQLKTPFAISRYIGDHCDAFADDLHDWIKRVFSQDADERKKALAKDELDRQIERLVTVAQLEILHECVPTVIADAVEQQEKWNQFADREKKRDDAKPLRLARQLAEERARTTPPSAPASEQTLRAADLACCKVFARETGCDRLSIERLFRRLRENDRGRLEWWDTKPPGSALTNGELVVCEAVDAIAREAKKKENGESSWFRPGHGFVDALVASRAANSYAISSIRDLASSKVETTPADTAIGRFFLDEYRVGSEDLWNDIPVPILLRIGARAMFLVRSCVLSAIPDGKREAVMQNPLFRYGFELPLKVVYWSAEFQANEPTGWRIVWLCTVGAALGYLVVVAATHGSFVDDVWGTAFLIAAVTVLFVHVAFIVRTRWVKVVIVAVCLAASLAAAVYFGADLWTKLGKAELMFVLALLLGAFIAGTRTNVDDLRRGASTPETSVSNRL